MRAVRVSWLILLAGCLLPPPIEEGRGVDNQRPTILTESVSPPQQDFPVVWYADCDRYRLFANVQDPDGDTIYWRVFVDYGYDLSPLEYEPEQALPNETDPDGPRAITFTVETDDNRFQPEATKFSVGHAVELLISDRPFQNVDIRPLGRVVEAGGLKNSFVWPITLSLDPPPGACPEQ